MMRRQVGVESPMWLGAEENPPLNVQVALNVSLIFFPFSVVCNSGQKLLTEPKGHVSSPNPGQSGTCSWKLDVPEDSRIIFYFKFYDIDHCSDDSYPVTKCTGCTRIELKDSSNEPPWHTFCDYKSELPEPISTNTSTLFVNFVLSRDDSKSWFTAEYETWPSQGSNNFKCFCCFCVLLNVFFVNVNNCSWFEERW